MHLSHLPSAGRSTSQQKTVFKINSNLFRSMNWNVLIQLSFLSNFCLFSHQVFHLGKSKPKLTKWTLRSRKSLRRRRRNSGRSLRFVTLTCFNHTYNIFYLISHVFIYTHTYINIYILNLFQYEGEIQVLYQVNVIHNLTNKKWSGKELPVKAGEALDVIAKAVDNKLICRNEDGKCEYLFTQLYWLIDRYI